MGKTRAPRTLSLSQQTAKTMRFSIVVKYKRMAITPVPKLSPYNQAREDKQSEWFHERADRIKNLQDGIDLLQQLDGASAESASERKKFLADRDQVLVLAHLDIERETTHDEYFARLEASKEKKPKNVVVATTRKFADPEFMDSVTHRRIDDKRYEYVQGKRIPREEAAHITENMMHAIMNLMAEGKPRVVVAAEMQLALGKRHGSIENRNMYESHLKKDFWSAGFTEAFMDDPKMILHIFLKSLGKGRCLWAGAYDAHIYSKKEMHDITSNIKKSHGISTEKEYKASDRACCACNLKDMCPSKIANSNHSGGTAGALSEDLALNPHNAAAQLMALVGLHLCTKCQDSWLTVVNKDGLKSLLLSLGELPHVAKICILHTLKVKCVSTNFVAPVYPTAAEPIGQYGAGGMFRVASFLSLFTFLEAWLTYTEVGPLVVRDGEFKLSRSHRSAEEERRDTMKLDEDLKAFFESPKAEHPFRERFSVPNPWCVEPASVVVLAEADVMQLRGFHPIPSTSHDLLAERINGQHNQHVSSERRSDSHDQMSERQRGKQPQHMSPPPLSDLLSVHRPGAPPSMRPYAPMRWRSVFDDALPGGMSSKTMLQPSVYDNTPHPDTQSGSGVPPSAFTGTMRSSVFDAALPGGMPGANMLQPSVYDNTPHPDIQSGQSPPPLDSVESEDDPPPSEWTFPLSRTASPAPTDCPEQPSMGSTMVFSLLVSGSAASSPQDPLSGLPWYPGSEFDTAPIDFGGAMDQDDHDCD